MIITHLNLRLLGYAAKKLLQTAIEQRPILAAQRDKISSARTRIDLAKKDNYPDYTIGVAYGFRSGNNSDGSELSDFASVLFAMNLPFFNAARQKDVVGQYTQEWLQQKYLLDDNLSRVAGDIFAALAAYRQSADQVSLFNDNVLPQARQTVESMLAGYQANRVDFLSLIRSETSLYEYENQYWQSYNSIHQALAQLTAAVGEEKLYE